MPSPAEPPAAVGPRRTPVPTRRLLGAAGALAGLAALVPLLPPLATLWWVLAVLLALLLGADLLARPARGALRVERSLAPVYHVGREGAFELRLRNGGARPLAVEVAEVLPPGLEGRGHRERLLLSPGEGITRRVPFVGLERGEHPLPALGLRAAHPFGLLAYQDHRALNDAVRVAPGRPAGEMEWLIARAAALDEMGRRRSRLREAEREFESLRDYVVGDSIRRIDWKASARRRKPIVRRYESESNTEVILGIDAGRLMGSLIGGIPKLDLALTPVLDLAAVALRRGERVGFFAFDSRPRAFIPPRGGLAQLNQILQATTGLPRCNQPTSFLRAVRHLEAHHRKRCLVLLFTDFTDELSALEMVASLGALRRHVLILVAVGDPHLEAIFAYRGDDPRALFQKAVAGQLLQERRRTLARMERLGIFTLDAEPARLSGPLIRKFLEVRLGGVL